MLGLSAVEIVVILVVALIVLGPKGLPEAARTLAKYTVMFRRTLDDLKHEVDVNSFGSDIKNLKTSYQQIEKKDLFKEVPYNPVPEADTSVPNTESAETASETAPKKEGGN